MLEVKLASKVESVAYAGLRVLGVAEGKASPGIPLPEEQRGFALAFAGRIALADPIRPTLLQAESGAP